MLFKLDEVFPNSAPSAGTGEFAGRLFEEKFRMIFLQGGTPAGVVDDGVDEHPRAERMRCLCEFAKLVDAGRAFVKLDQCGIDRRQICRGVRTAETAEAGIGCGRRMHGQQMNDAAAKFVDDVRQLSREVAEFSRRRQRGVALGFKGF